MTIQEQKRGFTLIELLIVIAIVGLLAAIVLISLSSARNKAKDVAYVSYMAQMYRLVSDAVAGDYMTNFTGNGCLGVYPNAICATNADLVAALGQLSEVPSPGMISPYGDYGVELIDDGTHFRILAGVSSDSVTTQRVCNLAGWEVDPNNHHCYIHVKK